MTRHFLLTALVLPALLSLSACSGSPSAAPTAETPAPAPSLSANGDDMEVEAVLHHFGESYEWANGMSVTVSAPTEFAPSGQGHVEPAAAYVAMTVQLTNGSALTYDPAVLLITATSAGRQASEADDPVSGTYQDYPVSVLSPGESITFTIGFGVDDPSDVTVDISPAVGIESAIFSSMF